MKVAIYGASGHTARFILAELLRRGHTPIAVGRNSSAMATAVGLHATDIESRTASLDSPESLDRALRGADAVIHCAGPFLDTARPVIEAALRAGIHYFDLAAEQGSVVSTFEGFDAPARERGVAVVPAAGFYGALGDVLTTAAMSGWACADRVDIAIALDRWWPTLGTRRTGQRNTAPRLALANGALEKLQSPPASPWNFPDPFGTQDVVELPFTETILVARHLNVRELHNYLNRAPLRDLENPTISCPSAIDEKGRSSQCFLVDTVARNGGEERRIAVAGRDIYAVTAPIVVEALDRVCNGSRQNAGAFALGQLVDASDFLQRLVRLGDITIESTTDGMPIAS
jgi:hypothetical protein